jgi:hypothetical protein
LEYAAAHPAARLRVAILAPDRAADAVQLATLARLARSAHLPTDWFEPRSSAAKAAAVTLALAARVGRRLILGDPLSGLMQTVLALSRPEQVVSVDDGAATIEFVRCLASSRPLLRDRPRPPGWRRVAGTHLAKATGRTLRRTRDLEIFTVMPLAPPGAAVTGAHLTSHHYDWAKAVTPNPSIRAGLDLVGSSLVASGTMKAGPYLAAIAGLAGTAAGGVRYFAHRRETAVTLGPLASLANISVIRPDLPLELALRRGRVAERVITWPTSTAFTLPVALSDLPVRIELLRPPANGFSPDANPAAGRLARLGRLAAESLPVAA